MSDELGQFVVEALHVGQGDLQVVPVEVGVVLELVFIAELAFAAPFLGHRSLPG